MPSIRPLPAAIRLSLILFVLVATLGAARHSAAAQLAPAPHAASRPYPCEPFVPRVAPGTPGARGAARTPMVYVKASNTEQYDNFGVSLAVDGDTMVVSSQFEDSAATGVNGDQSSNSGYFPGAAYVFVRTNGVWTQQAYLKASNTEVDDNFGASVAIAGDTIVVGAPGEDSAATGSGGDQLNNATLNAGAAYVFVRTGTTWTQQAYLKASNPSEADTFGDQVAVDGDTIVVGAWREDSAATGIGGDQLNNAAANAGAAYVFVRTGTAWSQQAYLKAANTQQTVSDTPPSPFGFGDLFGSAVAVSGDRIVVGAVAEDGDSAGISDPLDADVIAQSGAVYVFNRHGTVWSHPTMVKASNPSPQGNFGVAVGLSGELIMASAFCESSGATDIDGNQRDTSAPGSGAAYVFHIPEYTMHMPRLQVAR